MRFVNRAGVNRGAIAGLAMTMLLAGCGGGPGGAGPAPRPGPNAGGAPMASDTPVKIGPPYTVAGVTYTPEDAADYDAVGYASWYGGDHEGDATASGESYRASAVTAAHATLPLPSYVEVTALDSGRTILVRVNDRGPFSRDRIIDLSAAAAEQLGVAGSGAAAVRVRRVSPSEPDKAALRQGRAAPVRMAASEDMLAALRQKLPPRRSAASGPPPLSLSPPISSPGGKPPVAAKPAKPLPPASSPASSAAISSVPARTASTAVRGRGFIVQVATFSSRPRADLAAQKLGAAVSASGALWRVRLGPFPTEAAARDALRGAGEKGYPGGRIMANDIP